MDDDCSAAASEKVLLLLISWLCFVGESSLLLFPKRFSVSGDGDRLRLALFWGENRFLRGKTPREDVAVKDDDDVPAMGLVNNARFELATDGSGLAICHCWRFADFGVFFLPGVFFFAEFRCFFFW